MTYNTRLSRFQGFRLSHRITPSEKSTECSDLTGESFLMPEITNQEEYLHLLDQATKSAREHALDCKPCSAELEAFLLSQASPELFTGSLGRIITFEKRYDPLKHSYIVGLPRPGHESSSREGRIVYATRLPIKHAVWEFLGRVHEGVQDLQVSGFTVHTKHDGQRRVCYEAKAHLVDAPGYISIRSRNKTKEDRTERPRFR